MARIYVNKTDVTAGAAGAVAGVVSTFEDSGDNPSPVYGYVKEIHFKNYNMGNGSIFIEPSGTQAINKPVWNALNISGTTQRVWYPKVYASAEGGADVSGTNSSFMTDFPVYSDLHIVMSGCGNGKSGTLYVVHETP